MSCAIVLFDTGEGKINVLRSYFVVHVMFVDDKDGDITRAGGNRFGRSENHFEGGNPSFLVSLLGSKTNAWKPFKIQSEIEIRLSPLCLLCQKQFKIENCFSNVVL